jgi:hypothetical protein
MTCNKKLLQYANSINDIKDGSNIDCDSILKIIKKEIEDSKKPNNFTDTNLYGIRYLLYKYFKSNILKDTIKSILYMNGNELKLLDKNIKVRIYIGNTKFKQNDFLIFECTYNNVKTLLIICNKDATGRSDEEFIRSPNDTYIFFYHKYLILYEKTIQPSGSDYTTLKSYIKKLSDDKQSKESKILLVDTTSQPSATDDYKVSRELLDKISKHKNKIIIKEIINNYDEYNIDKKTIDLDSPLHIIITEYYNGNYYDYLQIETDDEKIFISLVQIFISLIDFYRHDVNSQFLIYPQNFFYKNTVNSITQKYLLYGINNNKYILHTDKQKNLFVLFDKNLERKRNNYNAVLSLLNILECGFYSKYLYYGYNSFIVQLVQEIMNQKATNSYSNSQILKIFVNNIPSFSFIKE